MNRMKLSEFVSETLNEIMNGVVQSQEHANELGGRINPSNINWSSTKNAHFVAEHKSGLDTAPLITSINFDIAVTSGEDESAKGGIGIFAAAIGAGVQGQVTGRSENTNRVSFQVLVLLPQQK